MTTSLQKKILKWQDMECSEPELEGLRQRIVTSSHANNLKYLPQHTGPNCVTAAYGNNLSFQFPYRVQDIIKL